MKISNTQLSNIIAESIGKRMQEYLLKESIKKVVRESVMNMDGIYEDDEEDDDEYDEEEFDDEDFDEDEESEDEEEFDDEDFEDDDFESEGDEDDDRLSDINTETAKESEVRSEVEKFFKNPGVNNAPYAYDLYEVDPEKGKDTTEMKNARDKFAKCLNHTKNDNGYPYSWTSDEINDLHSQISNNQLSESIDKAVNKAFTTVLKKRK